jgi:hypothetical protein
LTALLASGPPVSHDITDADLFGSIPSLDLAPTAGINAKWGHAHMPRNWQFAIAKSGTLSGARVSEGRLWVIYSHRPIAPATR